MKFFIDFDDVLFNTRDFKKDLIGIFIRNGVSEKQFIEESYWDGRYNLEEQIKSVEKKYKIDGEKLRKDTELFFKDLTQYVFMDVVPFLRKINREDLTLISYGDEKIQTEKIKQAGLYGYFDKIVITHDKAEAINKILEKEGDNDEKMYFLDDRSEYIEGVKRALPEIITVLIRRAEGRYPDESDNMADIVLENLDNSFLEA
jgi:FMN phosphatase YigB (HAD superfamily)